MKFGLPKKRYSGSGLIEIVIGVSIFAATTIGLVTVYNLLFSTALSNTEFIKANYLLEEGVEAVRSIRDNSWSDLASLTPGVSYYLFFNGTAWEATTTAYLVDGVFDQRLLIEEVLRDTDGRISSSGSTDSDTIKADVSVSWSRKNSTTTKSMSSYFVNLFE